jgi:hypothetical protein
MVVKLIVGSISSPISMVGVKAANERNFSSLLKY